MNRQKAGPQQKQGKPSPAQSEEVNKQKQKAETDEVAGRHKNDGQKPYKGAR